MYHTEVLRIVNNSNTLVYFALCDCPGEGTVVLKETVVGD